MPLTKRPLVPTLLWWHRLETVDARGAGSTHLGEAQSSDEDEEGAPSPHHRREGAVLVDGLRIHPIEVRTEN